MKNENLRREQKGTVLFCIFRSESTKAFFILLRKSAPYSRLASSGRVLRTIRLILRQYKTEPSPFVQNSILKSSLDSSDAGSSAGVSGVEASASVFSAS